MTYHDGRSECWPELTLGEVLAGEPLEAETQAEDYDSDDALAEFWAWVEREYPGANS